MCLSNWNTSLDFFILKKEGNIICEDKEEKIKKIIKRKLRQIFKQKFYEEENENNIEEISYVILYEIVRNGDSKMYIKQ